MATKPLSIVVLISGSGSNLQAIIDGITEHQIELQISAVISNKADAFGLERAKLAGIPDLFIDHSVFASRLEFDLAMIKAIDQYQPDLVVLAGFMRILSNEFVSHYADRLINIHPSLLPRFKGLNTHQRALDAGHTQHGASVHFVSNELDDGPVIAQAEVQIAEDDDAESLRLKVLKQEHLLYPLSLKWFAQGRLALADKQVQFDNKTLEKPLLVNTQSWDW